MYLNICRKLKLKIIALLLKIIISSILNNFIVCKILCRIFFLSRIKIENKDCYFHKKYSKEILFVILYDIQKLKIDPLILCQKITLGKIMQKNFNKPWEKRIVKLIVLFYFILHFRKEMTSYCIMLKQNEVLTDSDQYTLNVI